MKDSHISRIIRGGGVGLIGEGVFLLVGFIIVFLSIKILGPREYGVFVLALTIVNILDVICKQGLHRGMLKQITQYRVQGMNTEANAIFRYSLIRTFTIALVGSLICIGASESIVNFFNKEQILQTYLIVLAFTLPATVAFAIFLSALQVVGRVQEMVLLENVYKPCITVCLLALLYFFSTHTSVGDWKTIVFLGIQLFISVIICIMAYARLHDSDLSPFGPRKDFNRKEYLHFSYPLLFQGIINLLATWTSTLMIGYFIVDPQGVGAFNVIFKISSFCVLALTSLDRVFAPIIGELYYNNSRGDLLRIYRSVTKWSLICAFLVFTAIVLLGRDVLTLFDASYNVAYIPLIILSVGRVLDASVGSVAYILLMIGESKIIFYNSLFVLVVNIVLNYLMVPRWGLWGGAIATSLSYCIKNIVWLVFVMHKTSIHPYDKSYFKTVGIFLICFLGVLIPAQFLPLHWFYDSLKLLVFFLLFGIAYWCWGVDDLDQNILRMVNKRLGINLKQS